MRSQRSSTCGDVQRALLPSLRFAPTFWGDVIWPAGSARAAVASFAVWFSPAIVPVSLIVVLPVAGALAFNWLAQIARAPHSIREAIGLVGLLNAPFALWLGNAGLMSAEGSGLAWIGLACLAVAAGVALAAYTARNLRR